ncbi:heavy-metal-associated domain-containing protein [Mangrovimonas aestuarii]|uniref:heavy-metal-associated domain-containing protein n=1 Tax=Mangrovimonas aestuarii TaxID=3018443 RepID=UPI0023794E40|nr:heavy-metal-associated domain-containing protein [Mangrovimonas aestuarii]
MKRVILSMAVIAALSVSSCKNEPKQEKETNTTEAVAEVAMTEASFGVRGNCGMCKQTIEEAANGVEGVTQANWDVAKKKIDVAFDGAVTNEMEIQEAIAASGYDTEEVAGATVAYDNLPSCCQYDRTMAMNQSGEGHVQDHSEHGH